MHVISTCELNANTDYNSTHSKLKDKLRELVQLWFIHKDKMVNVDTNTLC
jgi:hypothetical protein